MARLHSETFIDAPPERVWQVLTDFAAYPEWNPLLVEARGEPRAGARVKVRAALKPGAGPRLRFSATVVRADAGEALVWRGGVPGVLFGEHFFHLRAEGSGTRFEQGEVFTGLFSLLLGAGVRRRMERAYAAMNEALARRVAR
ncbi:SRPBCC domain-containing protein [Aggregicoccus sp. 17bor-14]|uniref:SRPBCC domain-containing protein n=1 Tax=Myxococcaceae TaxID=31 RepID=UPI00129C77AB|nr:MULTISPECIES: SRPBCC domain-containing protein [Myxococcaceae]MBF5046049.1 SRPBCC domain-containing protein [Simulacricoccus sp. 17bor-14]MRI91779.1 SRPBCC domain-containing protein [Aggregicoccus sp. 17bor-14]